MTNNLDKINGKFLYCIDCNGTMRFKKKTKTLKIFECDDCGYKERRDASPFDQIEDDKNEVLSQDRS